MTRQEIERDGRISPTSKLITEWLSRHEIRLYKATELSAELGVHSSDISLACYEMRKFGLADKTFRGDQIQLALIVISEAAHAAYNQDKKK